MNSELNEYTIKYRLLLEKALNTIELNIKNDSHFKNIAEDYLDMINNYLKDGKEFEKNKDLKRALASYSYAYGWIDSGVRIGLFYGIDRDLFTLYK